MSDHNPPPAYWEPPTERMETCPHCQDDITAEGCACKDENGNSETCGCGTENNPENIMCRVCCAPRRECPECGRDVIRAGRLPGLQNAYRGNT